MHGCSTFAATIVESHVRRSVHIKEKQSSVSFLNAISGFPRNIVSKSLRSMPSIGTYVKAISAGAFIVVGGSSLVMWVTPTEEEIFQRYNPDLQKRALANREKRQEEFDHFVGQLKEASRSNKPIWTVQKAEMERQSQERAQRLRDERDDLAMEAQRRRDAVRSSTR